MATASGSIQRDANRVPVQNNNIQVYKDLTLSGSNTSVVAPIFTITGCVNITGIYGVVTTDLGANHTAASWRLNDQAAQVAITAVGGTTLSAKKAGSVIIKVGLAAAALTLIDNAAGRINEPTTLETMVFSPFVATKKTAATTQIEYLYTTTDTPTSGVIRFFVNYLPISDDGNVAAV